MVTVTPSAAEITVRSVQYRDLDTLEQLMGSELATERFYSTVPTHQRFEQMRRWHTPIKWLSLLPQPLHNWFSTYVAEQNDRVCGLIQVSPFNRARSTWRIDRVVVHPEWLNSGDSATLQLAADVGAQLIRHCFETIWEARTWMIEVNVNDKDGLALYRQTGFQPLAHLTYWELSPDALKTLAEHEPSFPHMLPISNADAQLLYQLDTASMPPLVRQVFDHQIQDFKIGLLGSMLNTLRNWFSHTEMTSGYVFEPQRKAAIGHFRMACAQQGNKSHVANLTVHPAYTWLYPELVSQMAQILQSFPTQSLQLASSDYQTEREEYLNRIGAKPIENTLMMSRSVWHKLRESKPVSLDTLQLSDMLQGLQPARKPIPGRMSWTLHPNVQPPQSVPKPVVEPGSSPRANSYGASGNGLDATPSATSGESRQPGVDEAQSGK
mgnify:CR=1 FL=1